MVGRYQRPRMHLLVPLLHKEGEELAAYFRASQHASYCERSILNDSPGTQRFSGGKQITTSCLKDKGHAEFRCGPQRMNGSSFATSPHLRSSLRPFLFHVRWPQCLS